MGCGSSTQSNQQTPAGLKAKSRGKASNRKKRGLDGFSVLGEETPRNSSEPNVQNPLQGGKKTTPAEQPHNSSTNKATSNVNGNAKSQVQENNPAPAASGGMDQAQRNSSLAPNNYNHILQQHGLINSNPVVANVGSESKKRPFRQVIKEALQLAKDQRTKYGKFRKDEKHTVMELYDLVGLEEDTFLGPPNELQERLSRFTYPPPNMHMLRENEVDEDVVDFMLGVEEAKKRKQAGFEVAPGKEVALAKDGAKRRQGVSSEATSTLQRMKIFKEIPKTSQQTKTLKDAMTASVLFKGLDTRDFEILFKAFEQETFLSNTVIFEKGDDGDKFYLIETGRCQIIIPEIEGTVYDRSIFVGEGDTFGELGVMYGTPRAATVVTTMDTTVWWIDRDTYRGTLMLQMQRKRERYMDFLDNVSILDTLEKYERARIADVLEVEDYRQGDVVVAEGEMGDKFFIVEEGEVEVSKGGQSVGHLETGKFFGEVALLFDRPRAATIRVVSRTARFCSLTRGNFINYLGPLEEKLRRNTDRYKQYVNNKQQRKSVY